MRIESTAACRRHDDLHSDVAHGGGARRDQSLAGIPGLRLRSGARRRGRAAHAGGAESVRADAGGPVAARGHRSALRACARSPLRPRDGSDGHIGCDRSDLRRDRRVRPSRRRGHRLRAVLRLVRAGHPAQQRRPGCRVAEVSCLRSRLGGRPPRGHAAHADDDPQHAAQPDRRCAVGRRPGRARVDRRGHRHRPGRRRGVRAHRLRRVSSSEPRRPRRRSRRAASSSDPSARRSTRPAGRSATPPRPPY